MSLRPFPAAFLFGCGNSDSQCEAFEKEFADIRDEWYERRRLTPRGRATDFWNRFPEDVKLARDLGCRMFRFSVAWARVEPTFGHWNAAALDHYSDVVDHIITAGMTPLATLHHLTWPVHIEARGGMIADDFPSTFATYATKVAERLAPRVKHWITINEPNMLTFGYIKPWWERNYFAPPGLPAEAGFDEQVIAVRTLMRNLLLAHTAGRHAIKRVDSTALVGANPANLGLPVWLQKFLDRNVTNLRSPEDARRRGRRFAERSFLEHGKVDAVLATLTKTPARASQVEFGEVYFVAHQCAMVLAGSPVMTTADLARQKVAAVATSTAEETIRTRLPQSQLVRAQHLVDAVRQLDAGEVAAVVADDTRLLPILTASPGRYRLLDERLSDEPYAPSVTKGSPRLLKEVDAAVCEFIESGEWAASYARHIGTPVPDPPRLPTLANLAHISKVATRLKAAADTAGRQLPEDLLDRVRARGRIVIGVKEDVPGFGFRDPRTGLLTGLEIDIARAIARRIFGNEEAVTLVPVTTSRRLSLLRSLIRLFDPLLKLWGTLTSLTTTNWWHLGMAGKLPTFLCPPECVGQLDFVSFDYYWGLSSLRISRVLSLVEALGAGRFDKAPVYASGFYYWLKELGQRFPQLPIFVAENGCVSEADGIDRAAYLEQHLREVQRALQDGVRVGGYLWWSVTSNRELGHRFRPETDFGLHHIDLDGDPHLRRTATPSAERYRAIIQAGSVDR